MVDGSGNEIDGFKNKGFWSPYTNVVKKKEFD